MVKPFEAETRGGADTSRFVSAAKAARSSASLTIFGKRPKLVRIQPSPLVF